MYQLPHHDHYSSHHHHHQQQQQQQSSAALHPFPPFYLFPDASSAATTEEQPAGYGSETTRNLPRHKATHRDPAPAPAKPAAGGGGGRSRKSASKKAAAAGGPHGRKKTTEPLRGMGVEQLEEHLRLQEAAAAAAASNQKKLLLPKFKPAKKPVSRPAVLQQDPATFPDEHYGVPVAAAAVISAERQRQLQLLYQAWVRRVTGAVGGGGQTSPYSGIGGAGRSSTATAGGGSELSSIPKIAAFNHNNNNPYDDLPTCDGPCCLEKKSFSTTATAAMARKNSGIVIKEERFQETASDEAPLINSSSSSSNYHRLPAGLMMNSVQFTRRDVEAISTTTTGFCSRSARSEAPFYPYRESYYLNQLATLEMMEAYDDAQRKGNSSSACGMEYYEFFPSDKTTSGEIIMEGGTFTKQECSEEEEGVEVEDYLMLEPSGSVGYYGGGGGGEASCLTTSDHHHHEKYYSSSSAYTYTLASNPTTTTTTTTTTTSNSISSSLDLSLKLSF